MKVITITATTATTIIITKIITITATTATTQIITKSITITATMDAEGARKSCLYGG